jgi:polar amino acid transport system substrate-binding protein
MIAKEAARRLHVRLVTVRVGCDDKLRILDELRADATIAPLLATTERTRQYGVVVYSQASQCLFGRADDPKLSGARSLDDLNRPDVTIAVVKDAPQGRWLRTRLPSTKVIEVPGNITTVPTAEIVAGRANVATIDQYFFAATSHSTLGLASLPFGTSCLDSQELTLPIGLAVPKDKTDLQVLFTHIVADRRACLVREQHRVVAAGP